MGKNEADSSGAPRDLDDEIQKAMSEAEAAVTAIKGDGSGPTTIGLDDAHPSEELTAALERAKADNAQLRDKWLRAVADQENYKKRVKRDVDDSIQQATIKLLQAFLPTLDNLERALGVATEQDTKLVEGIRMVAQDFLAALAKHGITPVESIGCTFDPAVHDALQQVNSPDHAPGVVVQEFEKGYLREGRLLRPARVVVAGPESTGIPQVDANAPADGGEADA